MAEPTVTLREAEAHETLLLRLEALLGELRPLAARHPLAAVPAPLIALSESLLFDARAFTPRRRREALPAAAPDFSGLVVQLGQALAALDAFEARRSFWSAGRAAFVWRLGARASGRSAGCGRIWRSLRATSGPAPPSCAPSSGGRSRRASPRLTSRACATRETAFYHPAKPLPALAFRRRATKLCRVVCGGRMIGASVPPLGRTSTANGAGDGQAGAGRSPVPWVAARCRSSWLRPAGRS
jgi:hypothetical protein